MSVQSSVRVAGPFDGNDLTTDFSFEFVVFQTTDVLVIKTGADDIELPLVKDVDYTVTLNDSTPGGIVSLTTPLATGEKLTLTSDLQPTQGLQIPNLSAFHPQTLEAALDKLTILIQQLADKVSRTVQAPISGGTSAQQLLKQLAAQLPLVAAVYSHLAYIRAVAANQANVDTVAVSIDPINAIAADMTGTWQDGVKYDYGNCTDPIAGGTVDAVGNIVTVAGNMDDVNTVADNIADVNLVADNQAVVAAVAVDLQGAPVAIDYGDASAPTNPATPTGVLASIYGSLPDIGTVAAQVAAIQTVAANLADILAALSGALVPANNLSELTDPAVARANLGLVDLGDASP